MKTWISSLALTLLALSSSRAETAPTLDNSLAVHPLMSLLVQGVHITWEHSYGDGFWTTEIPFYAGLQPGQALNLGTGLGVRRYLQGGAEGWYASPQLTLIDWNQYGERAYSPGQRNLWLVASARAGYKYRMGRLELDGAVGGGYLKDFHLRQDQDKIDIIQPEWTPILSLSAGWAFGIRPTAPQ